MTLSSSIVLIMFVIILYMIIVEIFAVLFRITGMTKEKAGFQSISLFTNSGFTTAESEIIVSSHVRRRIALTEMIVGNIFSVIIVSLLINVFFNLNMEQLSESVWVVSGSFVITILVLLLLRLPSTKGAIDKMLEFFARKFFRRNKKENFITLLDNYGKDAIAEVTINNMPEMLDGKSLSETGLRSRYKMNFLMLKRRGKIQDVTKDTIFQNGDTVVIFGNYMNIKDLFLNVTDHMEDVLEQNPSEQQNTLDLIENYGKDVMAELRVGSIPDELKGKTLAECNIKSKYKLNVMMLKRDGMPIMVGKDTTIEEKDVLVLFGPYQTMKQLFDC